MRRYGFGLWQALIIILIVSGLMIVTLKYSKIAAHHTADTYVKEQLELYLDSVIEMTLLSISLQDRETLGCIDSYIPPSITKKNVTYSANIEITKYYFYTQSDDFTGSYCAASSASVIEIESEETHGMIMMEVDAVVRVSGTVVKRILRRTLQRP